MATTLADRSPLPRRLTTRRKKRRGLVLLMVVSLLALFLLMGVTFAILAIQYRTAASLQAQAGVYGDPPMQEMELVLNNMLFETQQSTALSGHGLLRDLYGNDYVQYPQNFNPNNTDSDFNTQILAQPGGQLLRIQFTSSIAFANKATQISRIPGYYNGRVLTIYSTPLQKWISTRVVQYAPPGSFSSFPQRAVLFVENPPHDGNAPATFSNNPPENFLINGAPFNGTGAGFDPNPSVNNMAAMQRDSNAPVALMPNFSAYPEPFAYTATDTGYANGFSVEFGGSDEPWDAADYQNMVLSFVPPRAALDPSYPIIPAMHRPDLLNFWIRNASTLTSNASSGPIPANPNTPEGRQLLRQIIFRPMPWDHPNFTGGNRNFASGIPHNTMLEDLAQQRGGGTQWNRVWDVDNDGDGVADSIWIDPGFPAVTSPSGRKYKRLAAILVKDLDGRANLNAHGNLRQLVETDSRATNALAIPGTVYPFYPVAQAVSVQLPRGLGFGPAEVDLSNLFGGWGSPGETTYRELLIGNPNMPGRYGVDQRPGQASVNDPFSALKMIGMPAPNGNHTTELSVYATPPDVWGRGAVAMDAYGQPAWQNIGTDETIDDPYEMELDPRSATNDSPYALNDMEWLLRYHDHDISQIRSRFTSLSTNTLYSSPSGAVANDHVIRESLSVMGSHVPAPKTFWRNDNRIPAPTSPPLIRPGINVLDLYEQRITGVASAESWRQWQLIVPFELQHGELFNINRLFGNGQHDASGAWDSAGKNLIDDPFEFNQGNEQFYGQAFEHQNDLPAPLVPPPAPPSPDYPQESAYNPRVTFARHLYCLLMLTRNPAWHAPTPDGSPGNPQDTARYFAQFAVNVVDFRDSDSICTGFEYDVFPFDNGWNVDGYLSTVDGPPTNRGVVWGVERPELLITETISAHDRRTEDLDAGAMGTSERRVNEPMPNDRDNDYDQRVRPKGHAFIEIYNPWFDRSGNSYDHKARELYNNNGVHLNATVADNSPGLPAHPVWRMLFVKDATNKPSAVDPDFPEPSAVTTRAEVDRSAYFVDPSALPAFGASDLPGRFHPSLGTTGPIRLEPGRYAVVGSSGINVGGAYTSYIGRPSNIAADADFTAAERNKTRRIVLEPGGSPQVRVYNRTSDAATDQSTVAIQPTVAIPLDMPRSFSVSEPVGGYGSLPVASRGTSVWDVGIMVPDEPNGVGAYNPPVDTPHDKWRSTNGEPEAAALMDDGTVTNFRKVCLQRLANPMMPWHAQMNPYITFDTSAMDLTCFNGITNDSAGPNADPERDANTVAFQSFQRGGPELSGTGGTFTYPPGTPALVNNALPQNRYLWPIEPERTSATAASAAEAGGVTHFFPFQLFHTLGYLNDRYGTPVNNPAQYQGALTVPNGLNERTFPWLVFNNRPFMSPIELLHVSARSQFQLLKQFSVTDYTGPNPYSNNEEVDPVFAHLPNFFQSGNAPSSYTANDGSAIARLFDYVETPSPFVHSERYYSHTAFSSSQSGSEPGASTYRTPYAKLSRFRDAGRVNLNTIGEEEILRSLLGNYANWTDAASIETIFTSRRGYPGTRWHIDGNFPSIFSNPFRPAEAADLMPNVPNLRQLEANATLLRSRGTTTAPDNNPLFAAAVTNPSTPHIDPGRSPFFRYQKLQKVANSVTTNSNCYAVWITIGYFEVEDAAVDAAHPDGFQLGQELGLDTGNTQRHRSFFLIDRSIPAGFIPGLKLNTDNCILLKRQID